MLCWYKRYSIYSIYLICFDFVLIWFDFVLFDLICLNCFQVLCAKNVETLVNSLCRFNIYNPVSWFFLFQGFNFILSVIVSFGSYLKSSSSSSIHSQSSSSKYKSRANFSGLFWTFIFYFRTFINLSYWVVYTFRSLSYNPEAAASTTFLFF